MSKAGKGISVYRYGYATVVVKRKNKRKGWVQLKGSYLVVNYLLSRHHWGQTQDEPRTIQYLRYQKSSGLPGQRSCRPGPGRPCRPVLGLAHSGRPSNQTFKGRSQEKSIFNMPEAGKLVSSIRGHMYAMPPRQREMNPIENYSKLRHLLQKRM